jgi:uncharacterized protein (DUF885 family)
MIAAVFAIAACDRPSETDSPGAAESGRPVRDDARRLRVILDDYNEAYLKLYPISATSRGDARYNDRLVISLTDEFLADLEALNESSLQRLESIDPQTLNGQDRVSYDIFKYQRKLQREGFEKGYLKQQTYLPFNQFNSFPNSMARYGAGESVQPFRNVKDYDDWLKRARVFPAWVDTAIARMRTGIKAGVVHPRVLMEKALPQLEANVVTEPTESLFYAPIRDMPQDIGQKEQDRLAAAYRELIERDLVPAYRKLHVFVRDEYLPQTRDTVGWHDNTNGDDWYRYLVRYYTTTDMTPEEIHALGRREVERNLAEMNRVIRQVGFDGTLQEFFEYLRTDSSFHYDTEKELLAGYEALRERIDPSLTKLFETLPRAAYVLKPIPAFEAPSRASASYRIGSVDGSRPGIFFVNTYDLPSRPKWRMVALSLHEAAPGHHLQLSLAQEIEGLPEYRKHVRFTAFIEGWGLYAESLGNELGVYDDPYQYFGSLVMDIWRANRLVVDTGIHHMGWTRDQAIEWMLSNMPLTEHAVTAEVERYIAYVGQALAYKIGQQTIRRLREEASAELGNDFDVRAFHTRVLMGGAMPLSVFEARIGRWVEAQR